MAETKTESKVDLAKKKAQEIFGDKAFAHRYYHNLAHTQNVVNNVVELANGLGIGSAKQELLQVAAWFHDTGFIKAKAIGHEAESQKLALAFMQEHNFSKEDQDEVSKLIAATEKDRTPENILEGMMKDADTAHIGTREYFVESSQLRLEWEKCEKIHFTEQEWIKNNLEFLNSHVYHTPLGNELFNYRKLKNIAKLEKQLLIRLEYEDRAQALDNSEEFGKDPYESVKVRSDRGIETMFRVALRNHNQLSKIADNKANILLSINALMISIVISSLASKLDGNPALVIPTVTLLLVCLIAMVFAILATRPKITSSQFTEEKLLDNKINILFFGNFFDMPLDKFEWGMERLMEDKNLLYGSLTKDLYFLGKVLEKKYRLLRMGYNIFMVGMVVAALAFIITFWYIDVNM